VSKWKTGDGFAKLYSRSHDAVIRVYDAAGNVIETHPSNYRICGITKRNDGKLLIGYCGL
jgi:hypothetical protein